MIDRLLAGIFGIVPHPYDYIGHGEVEYQYVSRTYSPDIIHVFFNKKHLFTFKWIIGVDAPRYSKLKIWYSHWKEQNDTERTASSGA
jgi:hypothetical protein